MITTSISRSIISFVLLVSIAMSSMYMLVPSSAAGLTGSEFNAGRIIDDVKFYSTDTMTPAEIQAFLNAKLPEKYKESKPYLA